MSVVTEQTKTSPEQTNYGLSVADAIWVAAAIAQQSSVTAGEKDIMITADMLAMMTEALRLTEATKQTIQQHIRQHCVANKEPKPNRSCVLYMTEDGGLQLYRDSDPRHPGREGAPSHPKWENLPKKFDCLREWYETVWNSPSAIIANDPLLNAVGSGKDIWAGVQPDDYVNKLRDGWDEYR